MSSPDARGYTNNVARSFSRRGLFRLAAGVTLATTALSLGGCFRPLYGPTASGGNLRDVLATIDVSITQKANQERLSHYVENELNFDLDGSGSAPVKKYRIEIVLTESLATSSVNQTTGQAVAAILTVIADYKLIPTGSGTPVLTGQARGSASYDRTPQRFQDVRAARDAQIRASKMLSEQIKTKLAAYFASHTS